MTKIELDKTYKTRDGREARVYSVDGAIPTTVHGAIFNIPSGWTPMSWKKDGFIFCNIETACDLVEVKPRIKRTLWINIYPNECRNFLYPNKEKADEAAVKRERIACVKVEIDCEEGEGLDG